MNLQDAYVAALRYASLKHKGQSVPGTAFPYVVHVAQVAMEVMVACTNSSGIDEPYAVTMALLHDTLEDTTVTYDEVKYMFGEKVAEGVLALTKFDSLDKPDQIRDSIGRIKLLDKEVAMVKLADRITNLDAPAADWKRDKRERYHADAQLILDELGAANEYLASRLQAKLVDYQSYVETGFK